MNMEFYGELHLIIGGMYSGKSSELINVCNKYKYINKNILYINSQKDTRSLGGFGYLKSHKLGYITSHEGKSAQCIKVDHLNDIFIDNIHEDFDVIGIDEAQFFDDLEPVLKLVNIFHKIVVVSGLNGDFQQNVFGKILNLIPHCDTLKKLNALCVKCNNCTPGIFSKRMHDSENQNFIGGESEYTAVCRYHMNKNDDNDNNLLDSN